MGLSKTNDCDLNQTHNNRLIPTAPFDHEVGVIPKWMKVNNGTLIIDYNIKEADKTAVVGDAGENGPVTNNLAEDTNDQLDTLKESAICTGDKSGLNYETNYTRETAKDWYLEDKYDDNLLGSQMSRDDNNQYEVKITEIQGEDVVFCATKVHNNKRKRTTTETSLPDIGGEHSTSTSSSVSSFSNSCQIELNRSRSVSESDNDMIQRLHYRHSSNGKPMRKVKKGLGIAAWIVAPPVVLIINFMRSKDDYDDDDDKHNDPLRPWNYKINYVSPHKR